MQVVANPNVITRNLVLSANPVEVLKTKLFINKETEYK